MALPAGVMPTAPASRGYTGGFTADLMEKDLGLALTAARESHSAAPLAAAAHQLYALMQVAGDGGRDFSAVMELIGGKDLKPAGGGGSGGGDGNSGSKGVASSTGVTK